jgi:hypothetical protein
MSSGRRPSSAVTRKGLAHLRPLQSEDPAGRDPGGSREQLPNGWFYNEPREATFWEDLEGTASPEYETRIEKTTKQSDYMSQIGRSSHRIRQILGQFEQIDQDTLLAMLTLYQDSEISDASDPSAILDESKSRVLTFITEVLELSQGKESLIDSLRTWLRSIGGNNAFLGRESEITDDQPDMKSIYEMLQRLLQECIEKTEKAACLHTDICEFWVKQIAKFKRIIATRDVEIKQLDDTIEAAAMRSKQSKAKLSRTRPLDDQSIKLAQLEASMRTIEEQKRTIENLRRELLSVEASRAAESTSRIFASSKTTGRVPLTEQANFVKAKVEMEASAALLEMRIAELERKNEKLTGDLNDGRQAQKKLSKLITEKDGYIEELEANNQKNLQRLALEKRRPPQQTPPPDTPSPSDDMVLKVA